MGYPKWSGLYRVSNARLLPLTILSIWQNFFSKNGFYRLNLSLGLILRVLEWNEINSSGRFAPGLWNQFMNEKDNSLRYYLISVVAFKTFSIIENTILMRKHLSSTIIFHWSKKPLSRTSIFSITFTDSVAIENNSSIRFQLHKHHKIGYKIARNHQDRWTKNAKKNAETRQKSINYYI